LDSSDGRLCRWLALASGWLCRCFRYSLGRGGRIRDRGLGNRLDRGCSLGCRRMLGDPPRPLGISLLLLGAVTVVMRQSNPFPPDALQNLRSALILVIGSVAISGTIASLTKNMIGRARPSTGDPQVFEFVFMSFRAGWAAFPSGHATTATACAVALAIAFPRQAFAWLSIGLIAALSRAFIGVHWLTDCLAGIALGVLVSLALRQWMEKHGHAFRTEPILPAKVLAKGGIICLSRGWLVVEYLVRQAKGQFPWQFLSRKP